MTIPVEIREDIFSELFGIYDGNAIAIEKAFGVRIMQTAGGVDVIGEKSGAEKAANLIRSVCEVIRSGCGVDKEGMTRFIELAFAGKSDEILPLAGEVKAVTSSGKKIRCLTAGQRDYMKAVEKNPLTIAIGPAGSGKTYLAVCAAVTAFRKGEAKRIILTRPVLEAGERLGFLPGDLKEKIEPYLIPLYDALKELLGTENCAKLMERGAIEIAPLAYMRGRTLSDAFVILDEAQNTTSGQMKMFLTRMGGGTKTVVTGDVTQIDLPSGVLSGLKEAVDVLDGVEGIAVCRLDDTDVVRAPIVKRILCAYAERGKPKNKPEN